MDLGRNLDFVGYYIDASIIHYNFAPACWALQPSPAMQAEVTEWCVRRAHRVMAHRRGRPPPPPAGLGGATFACRYQEAVLDQLPANFSWTPATRVVGVHVRRGDFVSSDRKGVLAKGYFLDSWTMLRYAAVSRKTSGSLVPCLLRGGGGGGGWVAARACL